MSLLAVILCAVLSAPFASSAAQVRERPNVILMLVDDLGYECIGANGGRTYKTPVVDRLAAEGVRFEQAFVQPNCTPTRVALMTGLVNARNYVHFGILDSKQRTFGHLFSDAGYVTAVVGKWQLGGSVDDDTPRKFGFQEYCLYHIKGAPKERRAERDAYSSRYINPGLVINGEGRTWGNNAYAPDLCQDFIEEWLGRRASKPFFLYYPMMLTHAPFDPTPDSSDFPGKAGPERSRQEHYSDMIAYNDKLVGRLLKRLEQLGLREKTLVVFMGDNGTPGNFVTQMANGGEVSAGKGTTARAGMHVPLVVNWPGVLPKGAVDGELVNVTDILPTICDAAGIAVPSGFTLDGISFWRRLLGERSQGREWIYSWFNPLMPKWDKTVEMAFTKEFKLYRTGEFYDWRNDPQEKHPLVVADLKGESAVAAIRLKEVLERHRDARPPEIEARAAAWRKEYEGRGEGSPDTEQKRRKRTGKATGT